VRVLCALSVYCSFRFSDKLHQCQLSSHRGCLRGNVCFICPLLVHCVLLLFVITAAKTAISTAETETKQAQMRCVFLAVLYSFVIQSTCFHVFFYVSLCISLYLSVFLCIPLCFSVFRYVSMYFSVFVCVSLYSTVFLCISLCFYVFLCICLCFSVFFCVSVLAGGHTSVQWLLVQHCSFAI